MDTATLLPLLDTSIKVALGALIAAAAMWTLKRQQGEQQGTVNSAENRRLAMLEDISAQVGNVSHSFSQYSVLVIESINLGQRWPQARKQELQNINTKLVREFKNMADAEAKLLMLGEKGLERTLRLYGAQIAHFRKQVYVGRRDISKQEIADLKEKIQKVREQFYDVLSKKYDRLLTRA